VGELTQEQVNKIAHIKMADLNATSLEAAIKMIEGTARSMGIKIV
jgi:large subunit ribosomal protein L11